jgi:predicted amidohydrolase
VYVAGAAMQGACAAGTLHGSSIIVDPHGRITARASADGDAVICAEHDPQVITAFRARLPLLTDRRPEAYLAT